MEPSVDYYNILLLFGIFFYIVSAIISSYIALTGKIIPHETHWIGKSVIYFGMFNLAYWSLVIVSLVTRKIGIVLLQ
jgi:hypothetical protein